MALMTKIRTNLAKAFGVFAALFIVYIVLDWGMDITQRKHSEAGDYIGKIDGTKISYREFSELLHQQAESYRKQAGTELDDETERQLRNQVWNTLVQQILVDKELDRLGILVTDDEIRDIILGANPPEMIARQFRDSLGVFNRAAYDRAVADPQNRQAWVQVENEVRRQRRTEKLRSMLTAATRVTEGEIRQRFDDRTISMEADYVLFDPNRFIPDSLVQVTDDDIQKQYNASQEEFKVNAARKVKFVLFNNAPSQDDSSVVLAEMNRFLDQTKGGMDFKELAKTYSELPLNDTTFVKHGDLSKQLETAVFSAKRGQIVGPVSDYSGYQLVKVVDERRGKGEFVRASHILLSSVAGPDSAAKIQKAKELLKRIRSGDDFGKLARENSEDRGSAEAGGDLGWNARGSWAKPFERAALAARVGDIVGPIRTQFGWHIIKVTGKDNRELRLVTLTMKVKASTQSVEAVSQLAQDFAYLAKDEGFEKSAEFSSYQVRETPEFNKGGFIPAIGINDAVINFAFEKSLDAISEPITVSGGIGVFKISGIREEGARLLEEVKTIVRSKVLRQNKMQKLREQVDAFFKTLSPTTDLLTAAQSIPSAVAQKTGAFKATDAPQGVGRDYTFIGTASSLKPGELSKPIEGVRGYYIMKLTSRTAFDSTEYASQRSSLHEQILQEKRNRLFTDWLTALREKADVEDLREKFYR